MRYGRHWHVNIILCFPRNKAEKKKIINSKKRDLNCMIAIYFLHVSNILCAFSEVRLSLPCFVDLKCEKSFCQFVCFSRHMVRNFIDFTDYCFFSKSASFQLNSSFSLLFRFYPFFFNNKKRIHIIRKLYFFQTLTHTLITMMSLEPIKKAV